MANLSKFSSPSKEPLDLVFNWHLLEPCNYACKYCFAKWQKPNAKAPAVYQNRAATSQLLEQMASLNPQINGGVRLNIAGGEPMLLYKSDSSGKISTLGFILENAVLSGMEVSMITI